MFCSNCGNQLPDNAKFCGNCGARTESGAVPVQQNTASYTAAPEMNQNAAQKPTRKEPKKKKKTGIIVTAAVMLVFYLIGNAAGNSMADSYVSSKETNPSTSQESSIPNNQSTDSNSQESSTPNNQSTDSNSSAYDKVFSDRYIVSTPAVFFGLDYDAYVCVDSNGIIDHLQFGHKDDVVSEWVETIYIPAENLDMQAKDEEIRSVYGNTGLDFVSLSTHMGYGYYSYTLTIRGLDDPANVQAVVDAGLMVLDGGTLISKSTTEENLLAQGYIKK